MYLWNSMTDLHRFT